MWWNKDRNMELRTLKEGLLQQAQVIAGLQADVNYANGIIAKQRQALAAGGIRLVERVTPQDGDTILRNLAVPLEDPLLQAVLCVLKGEEEIAKRNIAVEGQKTEDARFYAGALRQCIDTQERLLEIRLEGARKTHAGGK